jgi:hypothetical protein
MEVIWGWMKPVTLDVDPERLSSMLHAPMVTTQIVLYTFGGLLVLVRRKRVFGAAQKAWPLVLFSLLAPLSTAWSVQPEFTLRRGATLLASTLFALYLGERYSIDKLARLLAQCMCLMMLAVVTLYFLAPVYVVSSDGWKGLSVHKNSFGSYMGVASIALLLVRFRLLRWLRIPFLVLAVVLLLLSHSVTAITACAAAVAACWRCG